MDQDLYKLIEEARAALAVALRQSIPSDDQIIIGHVRAAHDKLQMALEHDDLGHHAQRRAEEAQAEEDHAGYAESQNEEV